MYDVHPYSMYGFLHLIADGSPNKHQRKKKSKGSHKSDPKVIDVLFFLCRYPLAFSSLPLVFFLGCLFGLPSVISCRNIYIEYGCTWCICPYNDCLKFGNSWGDPFVQVNLPSLMSNVVETWSIWETHFFPQS